MKSARLIIIGLFALFAASAYGQTNNSVGRTGQTAPTSATECGFVDAGGLLQSCGVSTPLPFVLAPQAYTDTVKSLTATADTILLAASSAGTNKSVCLMNIGLNPATITNGASAAVVGNGQALSPAAAAGFQGGGYCYPGPPTNAIHGISTLGTTIIVTVGQ